MTYINYKVATKTDNKILKRTHLASDEVFDDSELRIQKPNGSASWNEKALESMAARFSDAAHSAIFPPAALDGASSQTVQLGKDITDVFLTNLAGRDAFGSPPVDKAALTRLLLLEFENLQSVISICPQMPSKAYWPYTRLISAFNELALPIRSRNAVKAENEAQNKGVSVRAARQGIFIHHRSLLNAVSRYYSFNTLGCIYLALGCITDCYRADRLMRERVHTSNVWFPISVTRDLFVMIRESGDPKFQKNSDVRLLSPVKPYRDVAQYTSTGDTYTCGQFSFRFENPYLRHVLCYFGNIDLLDTNTYSVLRDTKFDRLGFDSEKSDKAQEYCHLLTNLAHRQVWIQAYVALLANRARYFNQASACVSPMCMKPSEKASKWKSWISGKYSYPTEEWLEYFAGNLRQLQLPGRKQKNLSLACEITEDLKGRTLMRGLTPRFV